MTIATVNRTSYIERLDFTIDATLGQRTTATVTFRDVTNSVRPTIDQTLTIADGALTLFSGLITEAEETPLGRDTGLRRRLTCTSAEAYCDRRLVTETIAAGQTLKQVLTTLVTNYLTGWLTLSASQVNGPTLSALTYDHRVLTDVLNELSAVTGYIWSTPYEAGVPVLAMTLPAAANAPFTITDADRNCTEFRYRLNRDQYRNRQFVKAGTDSQVWKTDTSTADGSQRLYVLDYSPVSGQPPGTATVTSTDAVVYPVGAYGVDVMEWTYRASDNTLYQSTSYTVVSSGKTVTMAYNAQFPVTVQSDNSSQQGLYGLYEHVVEAPETFDKTLAQDIADGLIRRYASAPAMVEFTTDESSPTIIAVGQRLTINLTTRNLNDTFLVTSVRSTLLTDNTLRSRVEAVQGTETLGSWLDLYRQWSGSAGGSVISVLSAGSTGGGVAATRTVYPLGGASFAGSQGATWVDVENQIPITMPTGVTSGTIYCRVRAQNAGVAVTPRLVTSSGAQAGIGTASTASTWVNQSFAAILVAGQVYTLQVLPSSTEQDVFALGYLDASI